MAVADVPSEPRVMDSLRQAWRNIWPSFWMMLLFTILYMIADGANGGSGQKDLSGAAIAVSIVGGLVSIFVGMPLGVGLTNCHLAVSRGEKPTWKHLGYAFGPRYWSSIGLSLLVLLMIVGGLILLILPGIYLAIRTAFATPRFVQDGLGIKAAIKASFDDTRGRFWPLLGMAGLSILLLLGGLLALIVGVFVAIILIGQMWTVYWRSTQVAGPNPPKAKTA